MSSLLSTSFLLGIGSMFHCVGMCGPLAMTIPFGKRSFFHLLSGLILYNTGRILVYTALGLIVGSAGLSLGLFGFFQWISILAGVLMILFAWRKWLSGSFVGKLPVQGVYRLVSRLMKSAKTYPRVLRIFLMGVINGLLPCGMVYLALLNAFSGGTAVSGAFSMLFFGLGTLPVMFFLGWSANRLSTGIRRLFGKMLPYALTIIGLLVILRGLNLGIPYVSPAVKQSDTQTLENKTDFEFEYCHLPANYK